MGAISSDGLFDVTLTVRVAARSEDATCPTCALARTFGASPDDARFDVTCQNTHTDPFLCSYFAP